jgi:hypothetical protein
MSANSYANKLFLQNAMSTMLNYGSNNVFVGTVTQAGTALTIASLTSGTIAVGSLITITGFSPVVLLSNTSGSGAGSVWTVNLTQTIASATAATAIKYTVQNLLNSFLEGISSTNYGLLISAVQGAENSISNATYGTSPSCGLRTLATIDDGSVFLDTSKSTNQYVNFNKKIKIASATVDANNEVIVDGTSPAAATLTIGSAGGNNINENHMTRPELLLACLGNSGIGNSARYSSSINAELIYLCQRAGQTTEEAKGFFRLSVPTVLSA